MAAGDAYFLGPSSIAAGSFLDVQPSAGVEAVVHTIYHEGAIEIHQYDGTNSILAEVLDGAGLESNLTCHVANGTRIRIKNTEAGAKLIGVDGMTTK